MRVLALGIGSTYTTEVIDNVTYDNKSSKEDIDARYWTFRKIV